MDDLLKFFVEEARELVQNAGQGLLILEKQPEDPEALTEVFRHVHTLKGSGGVLELHALVQVVHVAEELLELAKEGDTRLDANCIDALLDAMDQVSAWVDALDTQGRLPEDADHLAASLAESLEQLLDRHKSGSAANDQAQGLATQHREENQPATEDAHTEEVWGEGVNWGLFDELDSQPAAPLWLAQLNEAARLEAYQLATQGESLWVLDFTPDAGCFYQGDDPLLTLRQAPGLIGLTLVQPLTTTSLEEEDIYQCRLHLGAVLHAKESEVFEHLQYITDQVDYYPLTAEYLIQPQGEPLGMELDTAMLEDLKGFWENRQQQALIASLTIQLELLNPASREASLLRWLKAIAEQAPDDALVFETLLDVLQEPEGSLNDQQLIDWQARLASLKPSPKQPEVQPSERPAEQDVAPPWVQAIEGEKAAAKASPLDVLNPAPASLEAQIIENQLQMLSRCTEASLQAGALSSAQQLLSNLAKACHASQPQAVLEAKDSAELQAALKNWLNLEDGDAKPAQSKQEASQTPVPVAAKQQATQKEASKEVAKAAAPMIRSYKVDHEQVEQLGDLVGELIVAKNTLPFLAQRAEQVYGERRIAREIREQFNVINRITRALQDAMMQVQMLPVSHVFQRFPRLVRDLSRKLGKPIELDVTGEDTEAEKHVIESLSDPLIHLMRNSIDHGIEMPEAREAAGKPATGQIRLTAYQENEWVVIEVADDGQGIDPDAMRMKAYEKGLVDERRIKEMSDQEAQELIFAAGFSSKDQATDLSGRGIGMDVVRTTIEKAGGRLELHSRAGEGTCTRLKLPLSMSVSQVMQIWIDGQRYGVPMDQVAETVRLPKDRLHQFKNKETVILREQVLPVSRSRQLLGLDEPEHQETIALLIVRLRGEPVALMVDDFSEGVEVILKPMEGALESLGVYQGTALLGDGSVLLVLDLPNLL